MSAIGRNSSLFSGEASVAQPVPVNRASPGQITSYEARKARLARLSIAAAKARQRRERMEAARPPVDVVLETIKRAANKPMPVATVRDIINVGPGFKFRHEPSIVEIQRYIAKLHGLTVEQLQGPRRMKPLARARQIACFCVWALKPSISLPEIGRCFGGKDHTTILWAVRKMSAEFQAPTRMNAHYVAKALMAEAGYIWPDSQPQGEGEGE